MFYSFQWNLHTGGLLVPHHDHLGGGYAQRNSSKKASKWPKVAELIGRNLLISRAEVPLPRTCHMAGCHSLLKLNPRLGITYWRPELAATFQGMFCNGRFSHFQSTANKTQQ